MEQTKISVVLPCYNVANYICRGLDSILAQTLQDWEAILVDDGATDDTGKICDEYAKKDSRFHVIHTKNQGVIKARNAGMEYAHGELLYIMDPDDWIEPECFSKCYETYKEYDCDMIHFGTRWIYSDRIFEQPNKFGIFNKGPEIWKEYTSQLVGFSQKALDGYYAGKNIWFLRRTESMWRYMFRRAFVTEKNLQFPDSPLYQDGFFLVEATYKASKLVSIPYILHNYFQRENSAINHEKSVEFIFNYKYKQLSVTKQLRDMVKEFDLHDYYMGSHVLSCLKMALLFAKKMSNYKLYYKYVSHPEVQESIRKVCLKGAPLKFSIPVRLLKLHCALLLFIGCWVLNKTGKASKFIQSSI
jgi:glycosyltransferase involved in cell wall biosynthesis